MKFKIGDKVLYKKEKQRGVVTEILSIHTVTVRNNDDFLEQVSIHDLIHLNSETDKPSSYGFINHKIENNSNQESSRRKSLPDIGILDLHVQLISSNYTNMTNTEIIQLQLKVCRQRVEKILNSRKDKLLIVHGIGSGLLKKEVHNLLDEYNLRYYLSRDGGSTDVYF